MSQDNYARTKAPATVGSLLGDVDGVEELQKLATLGRSPEWWEQHDRKIDEINARNAADAERARMLERAGELRDNGFPDMFVTAALGELADTLAVKHARLFVGAMIQLPRRRTLVLAGGVGAGKTTAATWALLKGQDPRPGFLRASELERRGRYDKHLDEWLKDKTSLVIDDIGAESLDGKGVFVSLLDEVVDIFYSNRRTLVMTTNLRPRKENADDKDEDPQFKERYGERVWSRLSQVAEWGDCGTRDLRREQP